MPWPYTAISFAKELIASLVRSIKTREPLWLRATLIKPLLNYELIKYPVITLPLNIKIYVNNVDTLDINIPDMFERREYSLHRGFIPRRGETVVDVGAYVGIYSLWSSRLVGDDGMVVAFEPNPETYCWLINNIKLNNANNIHPMPYALGDSIGIAELYVPKINIEASSLIKDHLLQNPLGNLGLLKRFRVPVITLDYFLENVRRFISRDVNIIDIMKIDVEGYELKVLMGAEKTLSKGIVDRFIIEVHIDQVSTVDIVKFLNEYGYKPITLKHFNNVKDMVYLKLFK